MSKIFVIDFDYTLFDTGVFAHDIKKVLKKLGVTPQLFEDTYPRIRNQYGYNLFLHLMYLSANHGLDIVKAKEKTDKIFNNAKKYVYKDVPDFLSFLNDNDYFSIIYSYGNEIFQKQKIVNTGIDSYVDDIVITKFKDKMEIFQQRFSKEQEHIIYIDDNTIALEAVRKNCPYIQCYYMQRPGGREHEYRSIDGVQEIKTLHDLLKQLQV